jgi:O-antigen/teichoic acid export membrane protein
MDDIGSPKTLSEGQKIKDMTEINNNSDHPIKKIEKSGGWDEIGFHRSLAGFWYKLVLELGIILIPAIIMPVLIRILYPFPETIGYRDAMTGLFVLVFQVFDLGTTNTISRFIADENLKNPKKMIQYVQYFIWYQAFTGILQITVISIWALYFAPNTKLAYGIWIILITVTKQWPGFPNIFKGVLGALQQFNKQATIDFIQSEGIQRITEIVFVLLGKWYGQNNPQIGMILGIAMGAVFGLYLDDVIAAILAGYYLAKGLEPFGITFKRMFWVEFDWALVKRCFTFGVKTGAPGLISGVTQLLKLTLALRFIPQYTTFIALASMAIKLVAVSERLTDQDFTPVFTETLQNDKKNLCQYYNSQAFRFLMINTGFTVAVMLVIFSILGDVFIFLKLDQYLLTIPFILPSLLFRSSKSFSKYSDSLIIASGRANLIFFLKVIEELIKMGTIYLLLAVFQVHRLGLGGVIFAIVLSDYPGMMFKTIYCYIYVHKHIFPFKILLWQSVAVPILSTGILYSIFIILKLTILNLLLNWNFIFGLVLAAILLMFLVLAVYFPLTVFLGGWDENSIKDFKKIQSMVGPSTFIVHPMAKLIFKTVNYSKLHNKFRLDSDLERLAFQELEHLKEIQKQNLIQFKNSEK